MGSLFRNLGLAVLTLSCLTLSYMPACAQDKRSTAAEQAELQAIIDTDGLPMAKNAQAAIDLAGSDPAQACQLAKSSQHMAFDAKRRFGLVYTQMSNEGVDVSSLTDMKARMEIAPEKMLELAQYVCSGQLAAYEKDPATQDYMKIGVYMKAYTDDAIAAQTALDAGDSATSCQRARDGEQQITDLTAYLADLRKRRTFSAEDMQAMDQLDKQITGFHAANANRLKVCPAS